MAQYVAKKKQRPGKLNKVSEVSIRGNLKPDSRVACTLLSPTEHSSSGLRTYFGNYSTSPQSSCS